MAYGPDTPKLNKLLLKYEKFAQTKRKRSERFSLDIQYLNIHSLPDLRSYTKLDTLWIRGKQFTTLPPLPPTLKALMLYDTSVTSLPDQLPPGLKELDCDLSPISALPPLPQTLEVLHCGQTLLTSLPDLPPRLDTLLCDETPLSALPPLPASLTKLACEETRITSLPELPAGLQYLRCGTNPNLTSLPTLPDSLDHLDCSETSVQSLPSLPPRLEWLNCNQTPIKSLPTIPDRLNCLYISGTQITVLPKLPDRFYYDDYGLRVSNTPLLLQKAPEESYCSYLLRWDELREQLEEKERILERTKILAEEIIAAGWHPNRFERWCLDEEEKKENDMMIGH